jgi:hypothetical protein
MSMDLVGIMFFWKWPPTFFYSVILDGYPPGIMRNFIMRIMPCNDLGRWVYKYKACTCASGAFSPIKPSPSVFTLHITPLLWESCQPNWPIRSQVLSNKLPHSFWLVTYYLQLWVWTVIFFITLFASWMKTT